jgi:hypothetical protein
MIRASNQNIMGMLASLLNEQCSCALHLTAVFGNVRAGQVWTTCPALTTNPCSGGINGCPITYNFIYAQAISPPMVRLGGLMDSGH